MARPVQPRPKAVSWLQNKALLSIAVLIIMALIAIAMLFIPLRANAADLDPIALSRAITAQCAGGMTTGKKTEVSVGLQRFFMGVKAKAQVSEGDVTAISEQLVATEQGVELAKVFAKCVKDQTDAMLPYYGIKVESKAEKDERIRQAISAIGPKTPPQKLVEIFGAPLSSGTTPNSDGMSVDEYSYNYMAYASDYRLGANRVALVLGTKDPMLGASMLFDQIADVDVGKAADLCGGVAESAHWNVQSNVCPANQSNDYVAEVFFFPSARFTEMKKETNSLVCRSENSDPSKCPGYASAPALAVAMISNPDQSESVDDRLTKVAGAFGAELDFGGGIGVLSPAEAAAFMKHEDEANALSPAQLDARTDAETIKRAEIYKSLLH